MFYCRDIHHHRRYASRDDAVVKKYFITKCIVRSKSSRCEVKDCFDDLTTSARGKCTLSIVASLYNSIGMRFVASAQHGLTIMSATLRMRHEKKRYSDIYGANLMPGKSPMSRKDKRARAIKKGRKAHQSARWHVIRASLTPRGIINISFFSYLYARKTRTYHKRAEYDT